MAINLQKGQRENINVPKFTVGLGWDANSSATGGEFDLDASVFLLTENHKIPGDDYFVFYNNKVSGDGSVTHSGDNRTGAGDGDDEQVVVDLSKVNPQVTQICIVVTIHEAEARRQNFGQVRNAFIRIIDASGAELVKYDLDEDFSIETAVEFGRIYNRSGQWKFEAVGVGMQGGLGDYLTKYT
ncbi:MAG: tellurium resistance protein TerD [Bacteroidetes bacterium]|nr:MAG: tellurium resistance protein TerD [Bacteroidota bacterium]